MSAENESEILDRAEAPEAEAPQVPDEEEAPANAPEEVPAEDAPDYAALEREDVAALTEAFPHLLGMESLTALDDPVRYGELRELGLSPKEAYLATCRTAPVSLPDTRSHLRSAVPRAAGGIPDGMTPGEMSAARDLFAGMSDADIRKLYRKVNQ